MDPDHLTMKQAKELLPKKACRGCVRMVRRCAFIHDNYVNQPYLATCGSCGAEYDINEFILEAWRRKWLVEPIKRGRP